MADRLLTVKEAAERVGRSEGSFRYQLTRGTGPRSGKLAGRRLIRESDLEAWIASAFDDANEAVGA